MLVRSRMSGSSKVIVVYPDGPADLDGFDARAGSQIQLGFEREGIPTDLATTPDSLPLDGAGLVIVGGTDGQAVDLLRKARSQVAAAKLDIPIVFAGKGVRRTDAEQAGADEVVLYPAYLRDVVTVGRLLRGVPRAKREHLVGSLAETTGMFTLVRALAALGRSAVLTVVRGLRRGEIRFFHGEVTSAELALIHGQAALHQLLLWTEARFEFLHEDVVRRQQIPLSHDELFADAERFLEGVRDSSGSLSPSMVLEQDTTRIQSLGRQVPTEVHGVLRMFDGHRVLADILEDSPYRVFETLRVTQRAVEVGLLKVIETQRPRAKWRAVLSIEEWLTGQDRDAAVERATSLIDSAPVSGTADTGQVEKSRESKPKFKKGKKRKSSKESAPVEEPVVARTASRPDIDWGALVPRIVGGEVGSLSQVVPAAQRSGEISLPTREEPRERLETLDTGARERIFPKEAEPSVVIAPEPDTEETLGEPKTDQTAALTDAANGHAAIGSNGHAKSSDAKAKVAADKVAAEKAADKKAADKAAVDKAAADKASADKAADKASADKAAADKAAADKSAADRSAADKAAVDKAAVDKAAVDKAAVDKAAVDKAAVDKVAADKAAADKAAADKAAAGKAAADKAAADKAAADKAAADKAAADKAAVEKAAADKATAEKAAIDAKRVEEAKAIAVPPPRPSSPSIDPLTPAIARTQTPSTPPAIARTKSPSAPPPITGVPMIPRPRSPSAPPPITAVPTIPRTKTPSIPPAILGAAPSDIETSPTTASNAATPSTATTATSSTTAPSTTAPSTATSSTATTPSIEPPPIAATPIAATPNTGPVVISPTPLSSIAPTPLTTISPSATDSPDAPAFLRTPPSTRIDSRFDDSDKTHEVSRISSPSISPSLARTKTPSVPPPIPTLSAAELKAKREAEQDAEDARLRAEAVELAKKQAAARAAEQDKQAQEAMALASRLADARAKAQPPLTAITPDPDSSVQINLMTPDPDSSVPVTLATPEPDVVDEEIMWRQAEARARAAAADQKTMPVPKLEAEDLIRELMGEKVTIAESATASVVVHEAMTIDRSIATARIASSQITTVTEPATVTEPPPHVPAVADVSAATELFGKRDIAAPTEIDDEPSDGIVRQIPTAETAPQKRPPPPKPVEVPDDRPGDRTGEITAARKKHASKPPQNVEPSILIEEAAATAAADLAAAQKAVAAVAVAQVQAPKTADLAGSAAEKAVAEVRKDAAIAFSDAEEAFFRQGSEKAPTFQVTGPVETFDDLDEDYQPVGFWDRLRGKKSDKPEKK